MSEPIELHRVRKFRDDCAEDGYARGLVHDLTYLLNAYEKLLDVMVIIERSSQHLDEATLASECLRDIGYHQAGSASA